MMVYTEKGKDDRLTAALEGMLNMLYRAAAIYNVDQERLATLFIQASLTLMRANNPSPEWRGEALAAFNRAMDEGDVLRAMPADTHEVPSAVQ